MPINFKKYNLTIVDDDNISNLIKIDSHNNVDTEINYYELIEQEFIFGRYMYEKKSMKPIGYWFCKEEIANYCIVCWNSVLKSVEFCDIIIEFYRNKCIETGNTMTIKVLETDIELCNSLKIYKPIVKSVSNYIEFKIFLECQNDFLNRELHAKI